MLIVSNTTPISELAKVEQLELLRDVFGQVIIPQEVYDELMVGNHPAVLAMQAANWIQVRAVIDRPSLQELQTQTNLDLGECAAILLAEELKADRLIIDEKAGRQIAKSRRLPVMGTIAVNAVRISPILLHSAPPACAIFLKSGNPPTEMASQFWGEKSNISGHFPPELGG
jgi:uncharacterized protein